ncbi:MAG: hypothetical protein HKN07_02345 [Acidimicrobiia bacterium]|nr:hypothetical protein [Acidimicrobiia bacterium]NNF63076.1 hypothetical protein [Acidimicrobiia bacterium]
MDSSNSYYGHNSILAEYVGRRTAPVIWGHVQHGWTVADPFPAHRVYPGFGKFVWSRTNAAFAVAAGVGSVTPIGAPFLYLLEQTEDVAPVAGSVLVYPFHGWENDPIVGTHDTLIAELLAEYGSQVTVCLYWLEYEDAKVRTAYEDAGFRVITHGHRDGDPQFLRRQLAELQQHETIVSNRISTALWYGGAVGRSLRVFGSVFGIVSDDNRESFGAMQRRRWPEVCADGVGAERAKELAGIELGIEFLMQPRDLEAVLGWTGLRLRSGSALKAIGETRRTVRRLVERS